MMQYVFRKRISSLIRQNGESQNGFYKKNKARKIFRKKNIYYPLVRRRACACQEVMFIFQKIWHALFSCNTRFEIRPIVLLATI